MITKEKWNERVAQISRVTKVCKGGKKLSFKAIMIVGNELGQVGVGVGKADDVLNAITKGINDAKKNLITVPITKTNTMAEIVVCMLFMFYMIKYIIEFIMTNDIMVLNMIDRYMSIYKQYNQMEIVDNNYVRY